MNSRSFWKHSALSLAVAFCCLIGGVVPVDSGSAFAQANAGGAPTPPGGLIAEARGPSPSGLPLSETGLYIVQLSEPSLASYTGGIGDLRATSPQATGAVRLDASSADARAYLAFLDQRQAQFLAQANQSLRRTIPVAHRYTGVLNALALEISHAEALSLAAMDGVRAVFADTVRELQTDEGPLLISAPNVWNGSTGTGVATRGEGIVVGIIDSGINSQHPSFAAADGDGYVHTNPYGADVYRGWCVANPSFCNDKLIGAYGFNPMGGTPEDTDGHGSHTASTAAGNKHIASFSVGTTPYDIEISGVAPRANIVAYKVCNPSCPGSASIAAINSAVMTDEVDVLNYSISGADNPWVDATDLAFLDASNAGIFVAASAGNAGPGASTVAKTGPWNATVAASTINRVIAHTLDVTGPGTPPALQGVAAVPGENTEIVAEINGALRFDAGNPLGCTAFAAGTFTDSLALIQRGGCTFAIKVNNAAAAGATGVVMVNHFGGPPISMGTLSGTPPAVMLSQSDGIALRDYVLANPTDTTIRINVATALIVRPEWQDVVAGFSSRGPSQFELLKPDFIAPGVNILAAVGQSGGDPVQYGFLQGTSMSSPHAAGAGALLMALNPGWSPAEIRSALATSSVGGLLREDGVTPATPFDVGSGRLALGGAASVGLVMNETGTNYAAANPALGGQPRTLNQPSMVDYQCAGSCSWTRTVRSVLPDSADYIVTSAAPPGMSITVTPNNFTIPAGGTQELTITAEVTGLPIDAPAFGTITLETDAIWQQLLRGAPMELLNEQFTDASFPPAGWASYKLEGGGVTTWIRDTAQSASGPASARRIHGSTTDGNQDDWLVTPPLALSNSVLTYRDRGQWMVDYVYSGVWVSTESCDPADGDFVELLETADIPNLSWRASPVSVDLSVYNGQLACLAFRYSGDFAHTWWIDDVLVTSEPAEDRPVAASTLPIVVIPQALDPEIDVDPGSLDSTQAVDTVTNLSLDISNIGDGNLIWSIDEAPAGLPMRLDLQAAGLDAAGRAPLQLALDDGSGENAIGVGGAQILWLNRFTPSADQFPMVLDRVEVMFGYPASTGGINVGELVDIYLYEDADGNPGNGATHRASLTGQAVQAVNGTTWSTYNLAAPVSFDGPGDILIAVVNRTAGVTPSTFPAVIDQNSPSQQRSWAGFGAVPGDPPVLPLPTFGIVDSFGAQFAGNWLVRGFGTASGAGCASPADVPWLSVAPDNGSTLPGESSMVTVTFDATGLADGTYEANLCVASNDPSSPLVEVPVSLTVETPEAPAIELVKTVGTVEGVCAATDAISVQAGTTVYYCYTVTNTGNVTLNLHDLVDDQLGTIFTDLNFALTPGSSTDTVAAGLSIPAVINTTTTNVGTWTAYNTGGANEVTAQASATVTVLSSAIELVATVGIDPATCAVGNAISLKAGATVYYCYTVTNTGEASLNLHDLVDTQLGTVFAGFNFELTPGSSVNTVAAGLSLSAVIDVTTTSTATWTAYNAGPVGVATAQASATVTVQPTAIVLAATVGTEAGVCAAGDSVTVTLGTPVYWCYTVTNTGEATLNLHDLSDAVSGSILSGFNFALAPGASVNTVAAGLTLTDTPDADLVNVATWTAYNAGPIGTASAQASSSVTVLFPADISGTMTVAGDFVEGGEITYSVVLSNAGPGDQGDNPGDEFVNQLPDSLSLLGASASGGLIQTSGNQVRWNGPIASGASVSIQITARINAGTAGTMIENQALIRYDGTGDGSNDATRLTDWPETGSPEDPTLLEVELVPAIPVPTLSIWGMLVLMLLMFILAGRRRRTLRA